MDRNNVQNVPSYTWTVRLCVCVRTHDHDGRRQRSRLVTHPLQLIQRPHQKHGARTQIKDSLFFFTASKHYLIFTSAEL